MILGFCLFLSWQMLHLCDAGQACASCSGIETGEQCQHFVICNNDEECYAHHYTTESGYDFQDLGCSATTACHHDFAPVIGKRSEGHHFKCMVCCNETSLCNIHLNCSKYSTGIEVPRDCSDLSHTGRRSGVYTIYPYSDRNLSKSVFCEFDSSGNGWTVVQKRFDGSVSFYRNWASYKNGFGTSSGEYWIGNDILHQLTTIGNTELKIVMSDFQDVTKYAEYSNFHVADEASGYRLTVSGYSGNAGDALIAYHNGMKFSTFDSDNDVNASNCAQQYKGGWWYSNCHTSNLNGLYLFGQHSSYADGIEWYPWHRHHYSLKTTAMMIEMK